MSKGVERSDTGVVCSLLQATATGSFCRNNAEKTGARIWDPARHIRIGVLARFVKKFFLLDSA